MALLAEKTQRTLILILPIYLRTSIFGLRAIMCPFQPRVTTSNTILYNFGTSVERKEPMQSTSTAA